MAAPRCVCSCHSRVSFRRVTTMSSLTVRAREVPPHPFDGNLLLVTIVAAPSRWVVVSVEARSEWDRAENPSSSLSLQAARTQARHRCRRERRPRRDGFTQKAMEEALWLRPECTVPFSGRRGRRQQAWAERRRGENRRERDDRSVGLWLGPSRQASLGLSRSPERVLYLFPVHTSWLPRSCSSTTCYRHEPGTESPSNRSHDAHGAQE